MIPVLKFHPHYKSVIWGGERIASFKGIDSPGPHIGESWEISPMQGQESVVADGPFIGHTLNNLVEKYPDQLLGKKVNARYHGRFPLLVKLIDSSNDLSVQVHPDDRLASRRHGALGKTEMWYSIAPTPDAFLYAGFNRPMTPELFRRMIADNTLVDALGKFHVSYGDVYSLPAGRVHAIGRGNFVVEIQQASDITYRIYDYGRLDADGKPRELHVEQSVEAVRYDDIYNESRNIVPAPGESAVIEECDYFTSTVMNVDGTGRHLDLAPLDSFTIIMGIEGSLTVTDSDGRSTPLPQGQTLLIPACIPFVDISGNGKAITAHI